MKNKSSWIIIVLLLLVGVTSVYIASTYAKYTTELNEKDATATIAKWSFETDNQSQTFNLNLDHTYDAETLDAGRIAPGTSGKFLLTVSAEHTETGVEYTLDFDDVDPEIGSFSFSVADNATGTNLTNPDQNDDSIWAGHLDPGETKVLKVQWAWLYYVDATQDGEDTDIGETETTLTVPVTIKGVQSTPTYTGA